MSKLLTDDELTDKLYEDLNLKQFDPRDSVMIVDYLFELIQEQKRAHGEMVIGEDESSHTKTEKDAVIRSGGINMSFSQIKTVDIRADGRNELRAEQRERNAS